MRRILVTSLLAASTIVLAQQPNVPDIQPMKLPAPAAYSTQGQIPRSWGRLVAVDAPGVGPNRLLWFEDAQGTIRAAAVKFGDSSAPEVKMLIWRTKE